MLIHHFNFPQQVILTVSISDFLENANSFGNYECLYFISVTNGQKDTFCHSDMLYCRRNQAKEMLAMMYINRIADRNTETMEVLLI